MAPPALQHEIDDPALDGGDWLFKKDGQVYGPVEGRRLAELLYAGQLSGVTLVSPGDGSWSPLVQIPAFLVHVKKAEAARRVEQEVTGRRVLQARQARTRTAALVAAAALVVAAAVGVALLIGRGRLERDPLLEGFGAGISIVAPARIGVAAPAGSDEIEVALGGGGAPAPAARPRPAAGAPAPAPGAGGSVDGGDLVATQFDPARIQAVVSAQQKTLARCLREHAARDPDFAGEVPLEFTVGNEGRVVRVAIMDPRLRQGPLRDCFEQELSRWSFPRFPGQRPNVALVFRVGGP